MYYVNLSTVPKPAGKYYMFELRVDSGEITVNGVMTNCKDSSCAYDPSKNHEMEPGEGVTHDGGASQNQNSVKGLSKGGSNAIAIVVVILAVVLVVGMFIIGAKKGWWYRPKKNSESGEDILV